MIDFHDVTIRDRGWINEILFAAEKAGADYTFTNMLFWTNYYGQVGRVGDFVTQYLRWEGKDIYLFPAGQGDLCAAIRAILDDCLRRDGVLRFRGVTDDAKAFLEQQFPEQFQFTPYRDSFDYIYTVEELTELRGKKLQSKRNHCHRFESEHPDWHTEVITAENIEKCREMVALWYQNHPENYEIQSEKKAIAKAFDHFAAIGMDGWMLLDGEQVLGFSMGYRMNRTYYDVCFEKAFADVQGAYTMINREFSRHIAEKYPELEFLNREDDMGEPGLRKAKESYQPTLLLEKCTADLQGGF